MVGGPDGVDVSGEFERIDQQISAAVVRAQGRETRVAALRPCGREVLLTGKSQDMDDGDVLRDGEGTIKPCAVSPAQLIEDGEALVSQS